MHNITLTAQNADTNPPAKPMGIDYATVIETVWGSVSPAWPLRGMVASNPLAAWEDQPFEKACAHAYVWWEAPALANPALEEQVMTLNRITIKWCQAFFDAGQATIAMPGRETGLFQACKTLALWDPTIHQGDPHRQAALRAVPDHPLEAVTYCLRQWQIPPAYASDLFHLLLHTLPGWASYIQYRTQWNTTPGLDQYPTTQADYLALRVLLAWIQTPNQPEPWIAAARAWMAAPQQAAPPALLARLQNLVTQEQAYHNQLIPALSAAYGAASHRPAPNPASNGTPDPAVQMVFCIDVRSEPIRRALEAEGPYETFGYAGFFGLPIALQSPYTRHATPSCPVLLKPTHTVTAPAASSRTPVPALIRTGHMLYHALKHHAVTPFAWVETWGLAYGLKIAWGHLRSTRLFARPRSAQKPAGIHYLPPDPWDWESIPFADQCQYALQALQTMGLTRSFAPWVVLCGHGGTTTNNPYAAALDCGACGGRHGGANAQILAALLNHPPIRAFLASQGITIPENTRFVGALHHTTTDQITVYQGSAPVDPIWQSWEQAMERAQKTQHQERSTRLGIGPVRSAAQLAHMITQRAYDWSQTRPEWGLAQNAAFLIGPRAVSQSLNLEGRAFLHSYHWETDPDGQVLTAIMTAPLVVAEWINQQYLFSTWDPAVYGSGSKITHNVMGTWGIMQGNASDLMTGLPLQSVYQTDRQPYHIPLRLTAVVVSPLDRILHVVQQHPAPRRLITNGWIHLFGLVPETGQAYQLMPDLQWAPYPAPSPV